LGERYDGGEQLVGGDVRLAGNQEERGARLRPPAMGGNALEQFAQVDCSGRWQDAWWAMPSAKSRATKSIALEVTPLRSRVAGTERGKPDAI